MAIECDIFDWYYTIEQSVREKCEQIISDAFGVDYDEMSLDNVKELIEWLDENFSEDSIVHDVIPSQFRQIINEWCDDHPDEYEELEWEWY